MAFFKYILPLLSSAIETDTTLLAIITPYAAQVRVLNEMFDEILNNYSASVQYRLRHQVEINTVDSFQGK